MLTVGPASESSHIEYFNDFITCAQDVFIARIVLKIPIHTTKNSRHARSQLLNLWKFAALSF